MAVYTLTIKLEVVRVLIISILYVKSISLNYLLYILGCMDIGPNSGFNNVVGQP